MVQSASQLTKYKKILKKLEKDFPKGKVGYSGFNIDVCYGGNEEPDIQRVNLGGVANDHKISQEFLDLLLQTTKDNIDFWQKFVLMDIKELEDSLK